MPGFDSSVKLAATGIGAIVCAQNVKGACGGSSGQQASGQFRGLKLAMEGAFARLAAVHPDAKPFWGNFETDMAAVRILPHHLSLLNILGILS